MKFDPESIKLSSLTKQFEYQKLAREIDECENIDDIRTTAKSFIKLHMKHQETASQIVREVL